MGISLFLSACVSRVPVEEYALAEAAVQAAQNVQAAKFASGVWFEAEQSYKRGVRAYESRNYKEAEELFIKARRAAEEAELISRQEMQKTGDFTL